MRNPLLKDSEQYAGNYVATRSYSDQTVVASGKDPLAVLKNAEANGVKDPVIFYIPEKDTVDIY